MKTKEMKKQTSWFLKILFEYTQSSAVSKTCIKNSIFMNILPCKPHEYNTLYLS